MSTLPESKIDDIKIKYYKKVNQCRQTLRWPGEAHLCSQQPASYAKLNAIVATDSNNEQQQRQRQNVYQRTIKQNRTRIIFSPFRLKRIINAKGHR